VRATEVGVRLLVLSTETVSTEMGDHVRVQFLVPDIYFGM